MTEGRNNYEDTARKRKLEELVKFPHHRFFGQHMKSLHKLSQASSSRLLHTAIVGWMVKVYSMWSENGVNMPAVEADGWIECVRLAHVCRFPSLELSAMLLCYVNSVR